jgi:hypothetical protein
MVSASPFARRSLRLSSGTPVRSRRHASDGAFCSLRTSGSTLGPAPLPSEASASTKAAPPLWWWRGSPTKTSSAQAAGSPAACPTSMRATTQSASGDWRSALPATPPGGRHLAHDKLSSLFSSRLLARTALPGPFARCLGSNAFFSLGAIDTHRICHSVPRL